MKEYKFKHILGTLGDMQTEWWTEEDWDKWRKQCKAWEEEGSLGKEVEYTYLFDDKKELDWWKMMGLKDKKEDPLPKESYKFIIFDVSNEKDTSTENI